MGNSGNIEKSLKETPTNLTKMEKRRMKSTKKLTIYLEIENEEPQVVEWDVKNAKNVYDLIGRELVEYSKNYIIEFKNPLTGEYVDVLKTRKTSLEMLKEWHFKDKNLLSVRITSKLSNLKVPQELVEKIKMSCELPKIEAFSGKKKITLVGKTSSGKSSLLNYILSGKQHYVCSVGTEHTTRSISRHHYVERLDYDEINELRSKLLNQNRTKFSDSDVSSFTKIVFENVTFVDTPGLNNYDFFSGDMEKMRNETMEERRMREKMEDELNQSDMILFLVEPKEISQEKSDLYKYIVKVCEFCPNVIIVLTKFDRVAKDIKNNEFDKMKLVGEEINEKYNNEFAELIAKRILKFQLHYNLGVPVVPVQVKKKATKNGPNYFDTNILMKTIHVYIDPEENTYLDLRKNLIDFLKIKEDGRVPIHVYKKIMKKNKKESRYYGRAATLGVTAMTVVLGGSATLAGVAVAGGLGLVAGVVLSAVGALLILTIVGSGAGAVLITTGLVAIGGSMLGGIVVLVAGGVVVGGVGIVGGGLIGGAFTGAVSLVVGGTVITLTAATVEFACGIPFSARTVFSSFLPSFGYIIDEVKLAEEQFKAIEKLVEETSPEKNKNWRKKFREDRLDEYYESVLYARYKDNLYVIEGIFKGITLISVIGIVRVLQMTKEEQEILSEKKNVENGINLSKKKEEKSQLDEDLGFEFISSKKNAEEEIEGEDEMEESEKWRKEDALTVLEKDEKRSSSVDVYKTVAFFNNEEESDEEEKESTIDENGVRISTIYGREEERGIKDSRQFASVIFENEDDIYEYSNEKNNVSKMGDMEIERKKVIYDRDELERKVFIGETVSSNMVYKASYIPTNGSNIPVVVKEIVGAPKEKVVNELKIAQKVFNSQFSVQVFGYIIEQRKIIGIVMEEMKGGDILNFFTKNKIKGDDAILMIMKMVECVQYIHSHNIIHRDVKPQNFLCNEDGSRLVISDYGLAKVTTASCSTRSGGVLVGTFQYSPPESTETGKYRKAGDIFSLGMTIYHLATGKLPYCEVDNLLQICRRLMKGDLPKIEEAVTVPKILVKLYNSCVKMNPKERPTATELLKMFKN